MIPQIPFPQKASQTYEITGTVSVPLVLGQFVFLPTVKTSLLQVRKGVLYRILGYSFSANCSELDFREAFISGTLPEPTCLLRLGENVLTPKPLPIRDFYQAKPTLTYIEPIATNQNLTLSMVGTFDGGLIPGLPVLSLSYSLSVQELYACSWKEAFDAGKF